MHAVVRGGRDVQLRVLGRQVSAKLSGGLDVHPFLQWWQVSAVLPDGRDLQQNVQRRRLHLT
jgi:hypothetical protein